VETQKAPGVDYWRIQTGSGNSARVGGGVTYRPSYAPRNWLQYVNVGSVDRTLAEAQRMGASVTGAGVGSVRLHIVKTGLR
jgi:uncharacterized protein